MELRQYIRTDVMASALAHLSVLALILLFAEVHPFGVVTAEPISVDIVTPDEVPAKQPDPPPPPPTETPSVDAAAQAKAEAANAPQSSKPPPAQKSANTRPQREAALSPQRSGKKEAAAAPPQAQPQSQPQPQTQPPPQPAQAAPPAPGYTPPEPDLTLKYHVTLGLPSDLPIPANLPLAAKLAGSGDKSGDGVDATASSAANIETNVVTEFRRHLKTCLKLPETVEPSDSVMIKLRVLMTPTGRLARDPILIEASASAKGPLLMQSAISALQACQPFAMLPSDRYNEWKVLDLSFSPSDFNS